jgi:hypothetical protein
MAEAKNINIMKGKIVLALVTFFLALMAATAFQSAALAESLPGPSTTRDSLEGGAPKHKMAPKTADPVKLKNKDAKTQAGDAPTPTNSIVGSSGSPGAAYGSPIYAQGYYYAHQYLGWGPTTVYRSAAYSGTQYINVTHKIYKWNKSTGRFQYWANPGYTVATPAGKYAIVPSGSFQHYSSAEEYWYVDRQVKWMKGDGSLIAQRTWRTTSKSDYACQFSRGLCVPNGTEGSLTWVMLYH